MTDALRISALLFSLCLLGAFASSVGSEEPAEDSDYEEDPSVDQPVNIVINFEMKNMTVIAKTGNDLTLVCKVDVLPSDIQLIWNVKYQQSDKEPEMIFIGEHSVQKSDKFVQKTYRQDDIKGSSLTIKSVTREDSGQYGCIIANQEQKKLLFEVQVENPTTQKVADVLNGWSRSTFPAPAVLIMALLLLQSA